MASGSPAFDQPIVPKNARWTDGLAMKYRMMAEPLQVNSGHPAAASVADAVTVRAATIGAAADPATRVMATPAATIEAAPGNVVVPTSLRARPLGLPV